MSGVSHYLECAGREIHCTMWGAEHAPAVVAWHGLARTGRDMDAVATHLASRYRVVCPDTIGRGLSQWSPAPEREYCLDFYAQIAVSLVDQLGLRDPQTGLITTSNCHRGRINAKTLTRAANAKLSDPAGFECLMKAILDDPDYALDRELKNCMPMLEQLKLDGKVAKDGTCSDYVSNRHKSLELVHVNWGYAVFGRVIKGMDIVDRIRAVETGPGGPFPKDVPREAVMINKVQRLQQEAAQ